MDGINLNSLRVFLEVANSNSFLEAANRLYISQPAVSQNIAKLESDLGIQLFYRENRGISLTPSGELLYKYLKETKSLLKSCERAMASINDIEEGKLVIGVQSHIVRGYLMDKIEHFRQNHPRVKISVEDHSTNSMIAKLESRNIDFIVDSSPITSIYNNITIEPIESIETCFIKSTQNKDKITSLKDLEGKSLVLPAERGSLRQNLNKTFDEYDINVVSKLEFTTEELIIEAVRRNIGIGYVASNSVEYLEEANAIKIIDLDEKLPEIEINLVCIENNLNNVAKLFIEEEIKNEE